MDLEDLYLDEDDGNQNFMNMNIMAKNRMEIELQYKAFRLEIKYLKDEWKQIKVKPVN